MEKTVIPIKELDGKKKEFRFSDVIINMKLCDLEKMREILLDKKATKDSIEKLKTLDKVILSKKKTYESIERSFDDGI